MIAVAVALAILGWALFGVLFWVYRAMVADYRRLEAKCDELLRELEETP